MWAEPEAAQERVCEEAGEERGVYCVVWTGKSLVRMEVQVPLPTPQGCFEATGCLVQNHIESFHTAWVAGSNPPPMWELVFLTPCQVQVPF